MLFYDLLTIDTHYNGNKPFQGHTKMPCHANAPFPNRRTFGMQTLLKIQLNGISYLIQFR